MKPILLLLCGATWVGALLPASSSAPVYSLAWPLPAGVDSRALLGLFPDHDPTGGIKDFKGTTCTYDGHDGTDIVLHSFAEMDSGTPVVAASPGVVRQVQDAFPDRIGTWIEANRSRANLVAVGRADGSVVEYLHLRRWSTVPKVGDSVRIGDTLGMIGSSGFSDWPHLHLGLRTRSGEAFDPWAGPSNPHPGQWAAQRPHPLDETPRIATGGFLKLGAAGVSLATIQADSLKYAPPAPVQVSTRTDSLLVWVRFRARGTDSLRWTLYAPNGRSLWTTTERVGQDRCHRQSYRWFVVPGGLGTKGAWRFEVRLGQDTLLVPFVVGDQDLFAPRFLPVGGKSLRVERETVIDTLRVGACQNCTLSLHGAPPGVSLRDSFLVVEPLVTGRRRQSLFQVQSMRQDGLSATLFLHLVDGASSWRPATSVPPRKGTPSPIPSPKYLPDGRLFETSPSLQPALSPAGGTLETR
jgi:hypothetical protein